MYWNLDDEGTMRISGDGKMENYSCGKNPAPPWSEFKAQIRKIIVEEGITEIGIRAFEGCENLTHVDLPASVWRIHYGCFCGCLKLAEICTASDTFFRFVYDEFNAHIKAKAEIIFGINSFYGTLWALERWGDFYIYEGHLMAYFSVNDKVRIPDGVEVIGKFAFSGAPITEVKFSKSVQRIEMFAFENTALDTVYLPEDLQYIGYGAFMGSSIRKAVAVRARVNIDQHAFDDTCIDLVYNKKWLPSIYELAECPCEFSDYRKLKLQEKVKISGDIFCGEGGKKRNIKGAAGVPRIRVGNEILRKLKDSDVVLICIEYDKAEKRVVMVKSFIWLDDEKMVCEYLMNPCYDDDEVCDESDIWSEALIYQDEVDIRRIFPGTISSAKRIQEGNLRNTYEDRREDWYCSSDTENFAGPVELALLDKWLKFHPEYSLDSDKENIENPDTGDL